MDSTNPLTGLEFTDEEAMFKVDNVAKPGELIVHTFFGYHYLSHEMWIVESDLKHTLIYTDDNYTDIALVFVNVDSEFTILNAHANPYHIGWPKLYSLIIFLELNKAAKNTY